jgi:hypothetical protein
VDTGKTATRRQLVSSAIALGGLTAARSSVTAFLDTPQARAVESVQSDADLVGQVLAVEFLAIGVYEGVIGSGLLAPRTKHEARRALSQERAHVRALAAALEELGRTIPPRPSGQGAIDQGLAAHKVTGRLTNLRTEHDCVSLLLDLEAVAEGAYFKVMSMLQGPGLLHLAAQIMANEAQHAAAISEARRPGDIGQAVPYAYVEGKHQ